MEIMTWEEIYEACGKNIDKVARACGVSRRQASNYRAFEYLPEHRARIATMVLVSGKKMRKK